MKIFITATPTKTSKPEAVLDDALEALSRHDGIDRAEGTVGLFGRLLRRDYAKERRG